MDTTESDPGQTETRESTPAVQRVSAPEATGGQTPQTLWTNLRRELRTPLDAIIGYSELLLGGADGSGQADFIANLNLIPLCRPSTPGDHQRPPGPKKTCLQRCRL
jgi:signal transduction histidine kinase